MKPNTYLNLIISSFLLTVSNAAFAFEKIPSIDTLLHPLALLALAIFVLAYTAVIFEERIHLEKSKPVIISAGLMWVIAAILGHIQGVSHDDIHNAMTHNLEEYSQLLLFLLVAMTYINAIASLNVFKVLKYKMVSKGFSYRTIFALTGIIAFFLSSVADNLTTALIMGAVVVSVGKDNPKFIAIGCINVVVCSNAGGAFSPFGDITTLMAWQAGKAEFFEFFQLFIPSVINAVVPGVILYLFVPNTHPEPIETEYKLRPFAKRVCALFALTIVLAVSFENFLGLPPYLGMMTGLSLLMLLAYYGKIKYSSSPETDRDYDIFRSVAAAEWDTLLFFFGVMYCVGALSFLGYLSWASGIMYDTWGATYANITAGAASAVIDNIPIMFAILTMNPEMNHFQWLLITLCAGVGGSLLSVGSAAGVALMGQAKGHYTFMSHLKWSWAIALGYGASIYAHFLVNG